MNIAINTRLLIKDKLEGIGWFSYEIISRLVKSHPEHQFYFIFDRPFSQEFIFEKNVIPIIVAPQARHPILYKIWFDYRIPSILKKFKIDVFFSPDGFISLRSNSIQIPVIHDLNFEHYPEDLPKKNRVYYRKNMPKFAHKAAHIITVSEFSKNDIIEKYAVSSDKISVVYNAAGSDFKPLNNEEKLAVKNQYTNGIEYFVYVGSLHKRKNIERMIQAFDIFKMNNPSPIKLVIVGEKLFKDNSIEQTYTQLKHKSDIIFTGRLSKELLVNVIASARALIYVSYFEGFGIPIIEAMKCNVPVLTSSVTSMPEVAGDAAVLVDPFSVEDIANGMEALTNDLYCAQLVEKGAKQLVNFNWDESAKKVWNVIEAVYNVEKSSK